MADIANNRGDYDLSKLFGGNSQPEKPKPKSKDEDDDEVEMEFPWGTNWLSVHNPFLWRSV